MKVAVLGATGYVGGRLVPDLVAAGHSVRCVARNPQRLANVEWRADVDVVRADATDIAGLTDALAGIDVVYHLVHSMSDGADFQAADQRAARVVRDASAANGVQRIVYLGGLGDDRDPNLSPHLSSRHEVGQILASGPVPVTELRAAVIIGSGSASFEMLRSLTEVLPVMVVPKWVTRTRCQAIAIRDVLHYLVAVVDAPDTVGRVLDIGGPDILTYRQMMDRYARLARLRKRLIMPVPVLTPRLSSHWINVVTPLPIGLARHLVDSLINDVVVRPNHDIRRFIDHTPLTFDAAIAAAIQRVHDLDVRTSWIDAAGPTATTAPAAPGPQDPAWAGGTLFTDLRVAESSASPQVLYEVVSGIGGARGWYVADFLWQVRGLLDKLVGGVGMRRGRRHPDDLRVGDALDFFRVEAAVPGELLRLRAEMKVPGQAWFEWRIEPTPSGSRLEQRARFYPRGLAGRAYWYAVLPFHAVIFKRLAERLAAQASQRARSVRAA
ncbi:MAG: SDR family oxidoreductase [Acidimicrobiia bacterium]